LNYFHLSCRSAEGLQLSRKWHATDISIASAQTIALQNERNEVDILRRRMDASVLLIKALGGGWNTSQLPKVAQLR